MAIKKYDNFNGNTPTVPSPSNQTRLKNNGKKKRVTGYYPCNSFPPTKKLTLLLFHNHEK